MGVPHTAGAFGDLVDPRVKQLFYDTYKEQPSKREKFYRIETSQDQYETASRVGALPNFTQFAGQVTFQEQFQGYDTTATHVQWASGMQIERELYDDDRHGIWERRPTALAKAAARTIEEHAARIFNMAFQVDTMFYSNSEAVSLCSNSHTTTATDTSTASGFDNLVTSPLSAAAVAAMYIDMVQFRDDRANRILIEPNMLVIPVNLYDIAYEITKSMGKPGTANNDVNVHEGMYEVVRWNYLTDANNFFMVDTQLMKESLVWFNRVPLEFAFAEELENIVAKWRAYMRYSLRYDDWRWVHGANVS